MSDFYFGKISKKYDPNQLKQAYYKAPQNSSWFNGLKTGDYVLIIGGDKVQFWQAKKYDQDRMVFDVLLNDCGIMPRQLSSLVFFELNMELIIKSMRSTTSEKKAFFKLKPFNQYNNLAGKLGIKKTYQNPNNFRKIVLYAYKAELNKDANNHDNDIQLYFDNGILKLQAKPFIDTQLANQFNGDLSGISGDRKEKIVDKFNLNGVLKKDIAISMRDLYDVVFSNQKPKTKNITGSQGGNGTTTMTGSATKASKTPLNQILYGPPGTGKTYHTVDKSLEILMPTVPQKREDQKKEFDNFKTQGRIVFTTFHQSMSYEDFIEGIKPETVNGNVNYSVKPGIFKELCEKAKNDPENPYVLIIDEINRGNVSQIFGELITLIEPDKRLGNENELTAKLPYSPKDEFGVPNNLYIIGTMNTADRSVEAIDTALRRRFSFVEMMPKPELLDGINCTINGKSRTLKELLEIINKRIVVLKDREHQIGHSYFMKWNAPTTIAVDDLTSIFKNNIVPLLQEYFYGNYQNIGLVLGDEFVKKETFGLKFASGFEDDFDGDTDTLRVLTDEEWVKLDMDIALTALINE